MVSANMARKYIDVKMSGDKVESIPFKKCDNNCVEMYKSQGFTDMMDKSFPDYFAPVYRNIKANQVVPKGDPVTWRKPRKNPDHDLIAHYTGKCAGHIHGCKVKWNYGFLMNDLACVGTGKVTEVECIIHFSGNCVHDKQHPIGHLTGNTSK